MPLYFMFPSHLLYQFIAKTDQGSLSDTPDRSPVSQSVMLLKTPMMLCLITIPHMPLSNVPYGTDPQR